MEKRGLEYRMILIKIIVLIQSKSYVYNTHIFNEHIRYVLKFKYSKSQKYKYLLFNWLIKYLINMLCKLFFQKNI